MMIKLKDKGQVFLSTACISGVKQINANTHTNVCNCPLSLEITEYLACIRHKSCHYQTFSNARSMYVYRYLLLGYSMFGWWLWKICRSKLAYWNLTRLQDWKSDSWTEVFSVQQMTKFSLSFSHHVCFLPTPQNWFSDSVAGEWNAIWQLPLESWIVKLAASEG